MGVKNLWELLLPAGKPRSMTHLAVTDGFVANPRGERGYRIGIDASIWLYHATNGGASGGNNPALRVLFYRMARFTGKPFLPLVVFDGPSRPAVKRGKNVHGREHWLARKFQELLSVLAIPWRVVSRSRFAKAPGEAEAELAYLNAVGLIDAVLTDDVDALLFGARLVIQNPTGLAGNQTRTLTNAVATAKSDHQHPMTYTIQDISSELRITQGGLILIALFSGGDYDEGLSGCGIATAHALARCGFGDSLFHAAIGSTRKDLELFMVGWREQVRVELRTNSHGMLRCKLPALAAQIHETFPPFDTLLSYCQPVTSANVGLSILKGQLRWDAQPDMQKIASFCRKNFGWTSVPSIITQLLQSSVIRLLRNKALVSVISPNPPQRAAPKDVETKQALRVRNKSDRSDVDLPHANQVTGPAEDLNSGALQPLVLDLRLTKICSKRQVPATDDLLEYRVEVRFLLQEAEIGQALQR
ncbi:PIN domain-like protein [Cerioporus squamosus]|nr:PIN domain-like protein [Cerioporus squamosus]